MDAGEETFGGHYWGFHLNSNIWLKKALLSLTYSCAICEEAKHFILSTLPYKVQEAHFGPDGAMQRGLRLLKSITKRLYVKLAPLAYALMQSEHTYMWNEL